jgi:hypothetical protein
MANFDGVVTNIMSEQSDITQEFFTWEIGKFSTSYSSHFSEEQKSLKKFPSPEVDFESMGSRGIGVLWGRGYGPQNPEKNVFAT